MGSGQGNNPAAYPLMPPPSQGLFPGVYDPQEDFLEKVKEAYQLGLTPPASPDPLDILAYQARIGPLLEWLNLNQQGDVGSRWHGGRWDERAKQGI